MFSRFPTAAGLLSTAAESLVLYTNQPNEDAQAAFRAGTSIGLARSTVQIDNSGG